MERSPETWYRPCLESRLAVRPTVMRVRAPFSPPNLRSRTGCRLDSKSDPVEFEPPATCHSLPLSSAAERSPDKREVPRPALGGATNSPGPVAHPGERVHGMHEVAGSTPARSTTPGNACSSSRLPGHPSPGHRGSSTEERLDPWKARHSRHVNQPRKLGSRCPPGLAVRPRCLPPLAPVAQPDRAPSSKRMVARSIRARSTTSQCRCS